MFDQRVSLGFVRNVFKVMAQVYRRLTKVNSVDRIIRVKEPG
jgi:protein gp37